MPFLDTKDWFYPSEVPLPDSPAHPFWGELIDEILAMPDEEAAAHLRWWGTQCYWFFNRHVLSLGQLSCREKDNPHYGRAWLDHPWMYDRHMELQRDPNDCWYQWPRIYFKTTVITQNFTIWEWPRDLVPGQVGTSLRTLILTYKLDVTGRAMLFQMRREVEGNPLLVKLWPDLFYDNPKDSGDWSASSFRIKQRGNPKEATVTLSGLDSMPTSQHFDRIIFDDPVVRETVRNQDQIQSTFEAMQQATFLEDEECQSRYVGTHWAVGDPWALAKKQRMFTRQSFQDCYTSGGEPVLHSRAFLDRFLRKAGSWHFACQMRGNPLADSARRFSRDWLRFYTTRPMDERANKNVYFFIDTARSQKKDSDYTVICVIGLGADKNRYILDLHRERLSLPEFDELLFRLVAIWQPILVFQEVFGAARDIEHIRMRMNELNFRFAIEELPDEKVPKTERIESLMPFFENGRIWLPEAGFGHSPRGEHRETMRVFLDDEYDYWTPGGMTIHDDMLDCLAFSVRPKVQDRMMWPRRAYDESRERKRRHRRHAGAVTAWAH